MRTTLLLVSLILLGSCARAKGKSIVGSTPVGKDMRMFLEIPLTDSVDFIRWNLQLNENRFELDCRYGISKPNTNGFIKEKKVDFSDILKKNGHYLILEHGSKKLYLFEVNPYLFQLLDANKIGLAGDGGLSYTLSATEHELTDSLNFPDERARAANPLVFEGRTPCQELWQLLSLDKTATCIKLKWYFVLLSDSITGKPRKFYMNGTAYRRETMNTGTWQILQGKGGREILKLDRDDHSPSIYLTRLGENLLLFCDPKGKLFVGNEDFSYTLNRRDSERLSLRPKD